MAGAASRNGVTGECRRDLRRGRGRRHDRARHDRAGSSPRYHGHR